MKDLIVVVLNDDTLLRCPLVAAKVKELLELEILMQGNITEYPRGILPEITKPIIRTKAFQTKQETYLDYSCATGMHEFCEKEIFIDGFLIPCHCKCHTINKTGEKENE